MRLDGTRNVLSLVTAAVAAIALCGCGSGSGSGSGDEEYTVGMSTPISGIAGALGQHNANGAKMAIEEINANKGVNGHKLRLRTEDNACNPSDGASSITKLTSASPKPIAILGGWCSSATLGAMPLVQRARVPLLVDTAATAKITDMAGAGGNQWVFRWGSNDDLLAELNVDYLDKHTKLRRLAIVTDNTDYGQGGQASAVKALNRHPGFSIVSRNSLDLTRPDFSSVWARVKAEKPDAVLFWSVASPGTLNALDQYGATGLGDVPLVGRPNTDPKTVAVMKKWNMTAYSAFHFSLDVETPQMATFKQAWQQHYKSLVGADAGYYGYQGIKVLVAALEQAKSGKQDDIRKALQGLDYGPTLMGGRIKFDDHNQAHNNAALVKISDGTVKTIITKAV